MNTPQMQEKIKAVKSRIEKLMTDGYLDEAMQILEHYLELMPGDPDICSMYAVALFMAGRTDEAENAVVLGLKKDNFQFDLLYNLAYIFEVTGRYQDATDHYKKAATVAYSNDRQQLIDSAFERIHSSGANISWKDKKRIVFFIKDRPDHSLDILVEKLSAEYWVRKIIVEDYKQIEHGMTWADICWFEHYDELIVYGSSLPYAREKRILCRMHARDAFWQFPEEAKWESINRLIPANGHLKKLLETRIPSAASRVDPETIPYWVDLGKLSFTRRSGGYHLAATGEFRAGNQSALLLQILHRLVLADKRYKLYLAGDLPERDFRTYWDYQVERMGLAEHIVWESLPADWNHWLKDKDYVLSVGIMESFEYGIFAAMASGIKPVIHDYLYASETWDREYLFNSVDEAVDSILHGSYDSSRYLDFIGKHFSIDRQFARIDALIRETLSTQTIVDVVNRMLLGEETPDELGSNEVTVLIPCYNRAKMLMEDLDRNLKLGKAPKLIVDDCSTQEREWLTKIDQHAKEYEARIVSKPVNEGLARCRETGFQHIDTTYTAFVDDDDMLFCLKRDKCLQELVQLEKDGLLIIPRYMMNLLTGMLSVGYDRSLYDGMTAAEVLKSIASRGEIMAMLAGGSIGITGILREFASVGEFRSGEDCIMLARMLAAYPDKRVIVTDSLVHIRRLSLNTLSKSPSPRNFANVVIGQCIACYHCMKLGLANSDEVLEWIREHAAFARDTGKSELYFESELISYLTGEISEEVFLHYISLNGIRLFENLDELAPEIRKMRALLYQEPEREDPLAGLKELPLVSVVIPTFNRCEMLKRAIDSALKQDYPNIEVIVMDNCSEDGTQDMVVSRYGNEQRLVYVRNDRNIGPTKNSNKGFYEIAKGKYCLFLFDDDYFIDSNYIKEGIVWLETHRNVVLVFGDKYFNNLVENKISKVMVNQPEMVDGLDYFLNLKTGKYPIMPSTNTVLFRRDIALDNRLIGSETNAVAGDLTFLLRFSLFGDISYINKVVIVYTLHNGSLSRNIGDRRTAEKDDGSNKVISTTVDDIKEFTDLSRLAMERKRIDQNRINAWLKDRVFNYLYWRFNETVQSTKECYALLEFVEKEFPEGYEWLKDFVASKYGESIPDDKHNL